MTAAAAAATDYYLNDSRPSRARIHILGCAHAAWAQGLLPISLDMVRALLRPEGDENGCKAQLCGHCRRRMPVSLRCIRGCADDDACMDCGQCPHDGYPNGWQNDTLATVGGGTIHVVRCYRCRSKAMGGSA